METETQMKIKMRTDIEKGMETEMGTETKMEIEM